MSTYKDAMYFGLNHDHKLPFVLQSLNLLSQQHLMDPLFFFQSNDFQIRNVNIYQRSLVHNLITHSLKSLIVQLGKHFLRLPF